MRKLLTHKYILYYIYLYIYIYIYLSIYIYIYIYISASGFTANMVYRVQGSIYLNVLGPRGFLPYLLYPGICYIARRFRAMFGRRSWRD